MFQTADSSRNPIFSSLAGEGRHVWSAVTLPLNRPWFFVPYTSLTEDGPHTSSIMVDSTSQITELTCLIGDQFRLDDVLLVSPGWVNHTDGWKMEPLEAVWEGQDPIRGTKVQMFCLTDGRRYLGTPMDVEPSSLVDLVCVVSIPR